MNINKNEAGRAASTETTKTATLPSKTIQGPGGIPMSYLLKVNSDSLTNGLRGHLFSIYMNFPKHMSLGRVRRVLGMFSTSCPWEIWLTASLTGLTWIVYLSSGITIWPTIVDKTLSRIDKVVSVTGLPACAGVLVACGPVQPWGWQAMSVLMKLPRMS